jgi:hypothetical protein
MDDNETRLVRKVDVDCDEESTQSGALLNIVLGVPFIVGLVVWMYAKDAFDPLTVGLVGVNAITWGWFLHRAWTWVRAARTARTVEVPAGAVVWVAGEPRLPASDIDPLVDRVAEIQGIQPPAWLGLGAPIIISMGLAGTFFGLSKGLLDAVPALNGFMSGSEAKLNDALIHLLDGAKLAFVKSLAGIVLGTLWTLCLAELRGLAERARTRLRLSLVDAFPPVTPEELLAASLTAQADARDAQIAALRSAIAAATLEQGSNAAARADARLDARAREHSALTQELAKISQSTAEAAEHLAGLRGGEESSLSALIAEVRVLKQSVEDAAAGMPDKVGAAAGSTFSSTIAPKFQGITDALGKLSSQGGEAIADAFKESVGEQTKDLAGAMAALTQGLNELPRGVAQSGAAAQETLSTAAAAGAQQLRAAAGTLQENARLNAEQLRATLSEVQTLVDKLKEGGAALHGAFSGVAVPLAALPGQLAAAGQGVERAGQVAQDGAEGLQRASAALKNGAAAAAESLRAGGADGGAALRDGALAARQQLADGAVQAGRALEDGAAGMALNLTTASAAAGEALRAKASEAGAALNTGAAVIAGSLADTGKDVRESVGAELRAVSDTLTAQAEAQRQLLAALRVERGASADGAAAAATALAALQGSSANLKDAVGGLHSQIHQLGSEVSSASARLRDDVSAAAEALRRAGDHSAGQIRSSVEAVAGRLEEVAAATARTTAAVSEAGAVAAQLQTGGVALREAFEAVTAPLVALPAQLVQARAGLGAVSATLSSASTGLLEASGAFSGEAQAAAEALRVGGVDLAAGLTSARQELGEGFTAELQAIRGALTAQLTAQEGVLQNTEAQHKLMAQSAEAARQRLESLGEKSTQLITGIEHLRQTCETTVAALGSAAGDQRSGADQAIRDLLAAVKAFSEALDRSQGAVQDASLKVVASTEQVTAEAARRVAAALTHGAETFEASMDRVAKVGERLDAHGVALQRNLGAAEVAAAALSGHGEALVRSAGALKAELAGVVSPLADARESLMTVPGAVNAAVSAMGTERVALTGLGASLSQQAELVRKGESELHNRTVELRRVTDALGGQIAQHVDRLSKAQLKVAEAWQIAAGAVDLGVEKQALAISRYATQIEQAVGVRDLSENLAALADSLGPLKDQLAQLDRSVKGLEGAIHGGVT